MCQRHASDACLGATIMLPIANWKRRFIDMAQSDDVDQGGGEVEVGSGDGTPPPVPIYKEDMVMDFAPMVEILHSESSMKNQERGGPDDGAWCVWLRFKPVQERAGSLAEKREL